MPAQIQMPLDKVSPKCEGPPPSWDQLGLGLSQLQISFDKQSYTNLPVQTAWVYVQAVSEGPTTGQEGQAVVNRLGEFLSQAMNFRKILLILICRG